MRPLAIILAALVIVGCNRDPNVAKKRYLENGNKYFAKGKYKEASIMYRNALQKDQRYGLAYYHLALTDLKLGKIPPAVGELRRAIELIPKNQPEHTDSEVHLAEIYIAFTREDQPLKEVEDITKELLQANPNSYDGHRLTGDLDFVRAHIAQRAGDEEKTQKLLDASLVEYHKAMSVQPGNVALNMQVARALATDKQYAQSESAYKQLIQKDPTLVQAYTELYNVYLAQKKYPEAEQVLKSAAANNPKRVDLLVMLASFYSGLKRHDDMVAVLNQIKSHAKDYNKAYLVVGDFYFRNGDADQALKQYQEGMSVDSKEKATYQKRMIEVLMRQGKRAEAADINAAILKSNPKDADARGLQGTLLLDKGEVQKAISELQAVVATAPDNFVARYNLGRAHMARNELEQARQQFAEAIRQRPDYVPARIALAELQVMRGEFDIGLKSAKEVEQIDPRNGTAKLIEASALLGEKRYGDARQLLLDMQKGNPNSPEVTYSLAMVSMNEGKLKDAEETFRKAYELNPKDKRGLLGWVECEAQQGNWNEAIRILQDEIAKDPSRNELRMALGNVAVRAGNFDLAIGEFNKVLATLPADAKGRGQVFLKIGEAYRQKGDSQGCVDSLNKAKQTLPDNSVVVSSLALCLEGVNRKAEAIQTYQQAVKLDPNNAIALNNLAFLMAESGGDLNEALTYAQRAKQAMPNMNEISDTLGWIYLKKNLSDNAVDVFRDLVGKVPNNPTYRYHLGMAFSQKGDKPRAVKELQQALHSNPRKDEEVKIRDLLNKLG